MDVRRDPVRSSARRANSPPPHRRIHAVRLDDVQLTLALVAAVKTADHALAGEPVRAVPYVAAAFLLLWRPQIGAAVLAAAAAASIAGTHVVLILFAALIVAFFPDRSQQMFLLRTQLTALYLFAGTAKLGYSAWRDGYILESSLLFFGQYPWLVIWGTVVVELLMVPLLWFAPRWALIVGVGLHMSITVGMWTAVPHAVLPLVAFNALSVGLLYACFRSGPLTGQALSSESNTLR